MFNRITTDDNLRNHLFALHPGQLTALLEVAWDIRIHLTSEPEVGPPTRRSNLGHFPINSQPNVSIFQELFGLLNLEDPVTDRVTFDHLIYAYMIENTRIYEIFRRVLSEFLHGEKLGVPTRAAQHWLRNTEALFYALPMPTSIGAIETHIRPDMGANRRNAYYRMFGMDLNHGTEDNQSYRYTRGDGANNEFVGTFEELLREVWVAITNFRNIVGRNPTDPGKLAELTDKIHDMLITRRMNGNLSREEFVHVTWMSWFHLSLLYTSPIVVALRAEAGSEEQRLFKIASRVGLPAHGLARSYFKLAEPLSRILILIESNILNEDSVEILYKPGNPNHFLTDMEKIITHWSIISGRDLKAGKVAPS